MVDREDCLFLAKVAEQAERFDDMIEYMKRVSRSETELTVEERNLLSLAYKNATGTLRSALRVVSAFEQRAGGPGEGTPAAGDAEKHAKWLPEYKGKIEKELRDRCTEILTLIDRNLLPVSSSSEAKVFYLKLKGDYQRYLAEFTHESERKESAEGALVAYKAATELASADLPATNPVRLGLALNFSVFYYEVLQLPDRACQMAKAAFDEAVAELDKLPEEHYKDATLIMQLLRDNLTIWTADINPDGDGAPAAAPEGEPK